MELLRGLSAALSVLLIVALCGLPVQHKPGGSLLAATQEVVRWARPRALAEQGQRSVVLTQVSMRLRREARALGGPRKENRTGPVPQALLTKKHRVEPQAGVFEAPAIQEGANDSPAWRKANGLPGRIFYLHIWKCGGTNMCKIARSNGEIANTDWGCHSPDTTRPNGWRPCSDPGRFGSLFPQLTFVGSECPLKGNEPFDSPEWTFIVVLRDPLTQATSWYLHARQVSHNKISSFFDWTKKVKTQRGIFFDQFEDNLQTRFLCGWACNEKPVLDEHDFEKAKANLRKFKVVLRLEELNQEGGMQQAGAHLGWQMLSGEDKSVGTKRHVTESAAEQKFPNAAKRLKEVLKWDSLLYEYSKTLPQGASGVTGSSPR